MCLVTLNYVENRKQHMNPETNETVQLYIKTIIKNVNPVEQIIVGSEKINKYIYI